MRALGAFIKFRKLAVLPCYFRGWRITDFTYFTYFTYQRETAIGEAITVRTFARLWVVWPI